MLPQELLIERARELCRDDARLQAALMYGSFAKGEGDRHSDVEFWLFFEPPPPEAAEWISRVAPLRGSFRNEFGTDVAVFENGVRGEFHLVSREQLGLVRDWPMVEEGGVEIVVDRSGELTTHLAHAREHRRDPAHPASVQWLCDGFANWMLVGRSVLDRGEHARALDALSYIHRYLLWMARLREGHIRRHWATPSRALEDDLSAEAYARFAACVATLEPASLQAAYDGALSWGSELMAELAARHGVRSRAALLTRPG